MKNRKTTTEHCPDCGANITIQTNNKIKKIQCNKCDLYLHMIKVLGLINNLSSNIKDNNIEDETSKNIDNVKRLEEINNLAIVNITLLKNRFGNKRI